MDFSTTALLLLPLISAAVVLLFFRHNGHVASYISVGSAAMILLLALKVIFGEAPTTDVQTSMTWLKIANLDVRAGFLVDAEAKALLFVVAFVGFLIHVFSIGYMAEDPGKARYFGGLSIFMFSMLGITLADNLVMLFVFWELVGFSSYLLIAHYFQTDEAKEASK